VLCMRQGKRVRMKAHRYFRNVIPMQHSVVE